MENRRIQKELQDMQLKPIKGFLSLKVDESNMKSWEGVVVPEKVPYSKGAFRVNITFPDNYPFKPPVILFKTKIYHPNIDEDGAVCLQIINSDNWKPATKISQVIESLIALVNDPEPNHPLRGDLAEEFAKDINKFNKVAEEFTKKHGEKRPTK